MKHMTKFEYFKNFGITISRELENKIKSEEDVRLVFDAAYILDTDHISLNKFEKAKSEVDRYFKNSKNVDFDLSNSLSSVVWAYNTNEIDEVNTPICIIDGIQGYVFEYTY